MRRARKGYVDRLRPIMVVKSDLPGGGYRVIDGKKKVRASQRLGLRYIPALLKVRGISFEAPAVKTGLNAEFGKDRAALAALASAA
jgi:hypothetical protein